MAEQQSSPSSSSSSIFNTMPPRFAFWAGVVTSAAVLAVIGFIIMTILVVKGVSIGGETASNTNTSKTTVTTGSPTTNTNTAVTPTKTSIDLASVRNVRGTGDIMVVEYSDLQCPFCADFHPTMQKVIDEAYKGKVKWGYKHLPLTSLHPNAQSAAIASECAAEQGKFWEFIDYIFSNQSTLATTGITDAANAAGVNINDFNSCVSAKKTESTVTADVTEAASFGFRGTPSSLVVDKNGKVLDTIGGALPFDDPTRPKDVKRTLDKYVQ